MPDCRSPWPPTKSLLFKRRSQDIPLLHIPSYPYIISAKLCVNPGLPKRGCGGARTGGKVSGQNLSSPLGSFRHLRPASRTGHRCGTSACAGRRARPDTAPGQQVYMRSTLCVSLVTPKPRGILVPEPGDGILMPKRPVTTLEWLFRSSGTVGETRPGLIRPGRRSFNTTLNSPLALNY